ncbi:MAG: hypothetical protein F2534_12695 [Actinobacteria bacterium]|uniref:Unannotated protein n=1 Tax=freshwater metagenome TaxID=449393 RepID=A0A6J6E7Y9_9ZZZZ|nr:hypothetical protein [Actinomycetota bacterium]
MPGGAGEASVASDTACSPRVVAVGTEHVGGRVRTGGPWSEFVPSWEAAADGPLVTVRLRSAPGRALTLWNAFAANDTLFATEG